MKFRLIYLLIICGAVHAMAQDPLSRTVPLPEYLKNSRIYQLYKDSEGFLWLASSEGLHRFDGANYWPVSLSDTMKHITALGENAANQLLVGNDKGRVGVVINKSVSWDAMEFGTPVTAIAAHPSGDLWIATYGNGLFIKKTDTTLRLTGQRGLPYDDIYSLSITEEGLAAAGTDGGLFIIEAEDSQIKAENFSRQEGLPDNIVLKTALAGDGKIWVGMYNYGVCLFDPARRSFEKFYAEEDWEYGQVSALVECNNKLWIGSDSHGLLRLDLQNRHLQSVEEDFYGNSEIYAIADDQEGNVWIANNSGNLIQASGYFDYLYEIDGRPLGNIHAIHCDDDNNLWISSAQGLSALHTGSAAYGKYTRQDHLPDLSSYPVISIYSDEHGCLWLGTFGMGAIRYNPATREFGLIKEKDGLINGNVLSISGFDNELWFATLGGVSQCICQPPSGGAYAFRHFDETAGLGTNYIYQVFIDSKKREWFATDGKGVSVLENNQIRHITQSQRIDNLVALSLAEDNKGRIWFSSAGQGLFRYDGDTLINFGKAEGLSDLSVSGLATDAYGALLAINKNGIDIIDTETGSVRYLEHPLLKEMDPDLNTVSRDSRGNIWIGTKHGLLKYSANGEKRMTRPHIKIDDVSVYPRPAQNGVRTFKYNQNHFTFDYVGLWYQDPEKIRYQYMLEGFDLNWNTSTDRRAVYPRLAPGEYTFKVRAAIGPDFRLSDPASYSFEIQLPFWLQPYFIAAAMLFFSGMIIAAVRIRVRRIRNLERLKQEKITFQFEMLKSQVNPHFLFNSFNTLMNIIEDDKERALEYVEYLSDFFRNILIHRDKELITVEEEIDIIEKYYFLQKRRYESNLDLRIDLSEKIRSGLIAPLTLQLLVENAIKHNVISDDHQLVVDLSGEKGYIVVKNNRKEKNRVEPSVGLGLQNIKNRYAILTYEPVEIIKEETFFIVKIPVIYSEK